MRAAAQARAWAATQLFELKSSATDAPRRPKPKSAVIDTPQASPSAAASCPSRLLAAEARAPLSRTFGVSLTARKSDWPMRPVIPKIAKECTAKPYSTAPVKNFLTPSKKDSSRG